MLKIKDNVDLRELEKFGFKELKSELTEAPLGWKIETVDNEKDDISSELYVYPDNCYYRRKLLIDCDAESILMNLVFDLIQAGLVEKVK